MNPRITNARITLALFALAVLMSLLLPMPVSAHCDTMDGPVVAAAKNSLETGNPGYALIWVQPEDEAIIKDALHETLATRKSDPGADLRFFETLVRVHREGEGAEYTGLKPAGSGAEPLIIIADNAVDEEDAQPLIHEVAGIVEEGIATRFAEVIAKKQYAPGDVDAGREYVETYVPFLHYVEGIAEAAEHPAEHEAVPMPVVEMAGARAEEVRLLESRLTFAWVVAAMLAAALATTIIIAVRTRKRA